MGMNQPAIENVANRILDKIEKKPEPTEEQKANDREVMAAAGPLAVEPAPEESIYEPSRGAALLRDLIQRIDVRATERTERVADLRRRELEAERADREEKKALETELAQRLEAYNEAVQKLKDDFDLAVHNRAVDLAWRRDQLALLDKSLDQMRKQVHAEVAKLAPERKVSA